MNDIWWIASPKGGVGTSTIAATLAIVLAQDDGPPAMLVDRRGGDQQALLGMITGRSDEVHAGGMLDGRWLPQSKPVAPGLHLLETDVVAPSLADLLNEIAVSHRVVFDAGHLQGADCKDARRVMVMRACYLALSRAKHWHNYQPEAVIVVEEPGRALRLRDVGAALGQPAETVFRVPWDPRVARGIDAGTIVSMMPPPLRRGGVPDMLTCLTGVSAG